MTPNLTTDPHSDFWAKVRIPVRHHIGAVADAYCSEHNADAEAVRGIKGARPTQAHLKLRDGMIIVLHEAGFGPMAISRWFQHVDSSSIRRRMYDLRLLGDV